MTAASILTRIYESKEIKEVIMRLKPEHLQQDILQHTFLELFEKEESFILELDGRGKLKAYIVKILYNTATYSRSSFAKALGKETPTDICGDAKYEVIRYEDEEKERTESNNSVACAVSNLHWYKANMLAIYAELGTYKAVSEKTKIPLSSVFKTITEARKEIKKQL